LWEVAVFSVNMIQFQVGERLLTNLSRDFWRNTND